METIIDLTDSMGNILNGNKTGKIQERCLVATLNDDLNNHSKLLLHLFQWKLNDCVT